ncbi:MAG: hypothetical protein WA840_02075 [Caulobacteraceae bacterium]
MKTSFVHGYDPPDDMGLLSLRTEARAKSWAAHLAYVILLALLVFGGAYHEPWFDEAQAWLIARDSTPWVIVSHVARYEGSPALWHLVLWALQRLGYPYGGLWLISATLAAGGAWVILYRSPFPLWVRGGLIFSYFIAYQFSIVARSYSLDVLLFPLIALAFSARVERPLLYALLLGVLANANAHSFVLSGVLALELAWRLRGQILHRVPKAWLASLIYAALAMAAVLQAWPVADIDSNGAMQQPRPVWALVMISEAFIDRMDVFAPTAPGAISRLGGIALTLFVLTPVGILCARAQLAAVFFGGLLAFFIFSALEHGAPWHAGVLFLYVVALMWMAWPSLGRLSRADRSCLNAVLAAIVIYGAGCTALAFARDVRNPYSSSSAAAAAVEKLRASQPGARIAVLGHRAFSVQPKFPSNIFVNYNEGAARPAYFEWSFHQPLRPRPEASDLKRTLVGIRPDMVLMSMVADIPKALAVAKANGYCAAQTLHGSLVWKSYALEDDLITVLRPCRG